jgi:lipoate---protein ligase
VSPAGGWEISRRRDRADVLLEEWPTGVSRDGRLVAVCEVERRALVVGSAQPASDVDVSAASARGADVVRRSSGGGAVLVAPAAQVWIEVWLPRHDALWDDDIVRSAQWTGEAWARALGALGATGLEVHRGRASRTDVSERVCFAVLGPGEVVVGGRKVVGVSQRRTRDGARIQTMALVHWDPAELVELLHIDWARTGGDTTELERVAVGLDLVPGAPLAPTSDVIAAVEVAFMTALPS